MDFIKKYFIFIFLLLITDQAVLAMKKEERYSNKRFKKLKEFNSNHTGCKVISKNGKCVAFGSEDGKVLVFDIQNEKEICSYAHKSRIYRTISLSNDGKYVASGSIDGQVIAFDTENKKEVYSCKHSKNAVVALSGNGKHIVSGGHDKTVFFTKNFANNQDKIDCSYQHKDCVRAVSLSNNAERVVSGSADGTAFIIDGSTIWGKDYKVFCHSREIEEIDHISLSSEGKSCALGGKKGSISFFYIPKTLRSLLENAHFCRGYQNEINCLSLSDNGRYVVSGSRDGQVRFFDKLFFDKREVPSVKYEACIQDVSVSKNGKYFAFGAADGQVVVFDIQKNKKVCFYSHDSAVEVLSFSNDNKRFISIDRGGKVIIHETSAKYQKTQRHYEYKKNQEKFDKIERKEFLENNKEKLDLKSFEIKLRGLSELKKLSIPIILLL